MANVLATCCVLSEVRYSAVLFQFLNYGRTVLAFQSPVFKTHKAEILV